MRKRGWWPSADWTDPEQNARPARCRTRAGRMPALPGRNSAEFAEVGEAIAATPAKLEKIRLLAEYLRSLEPDQLPIAAIYFTGKPFAQSDVRTLQVGWSGHFPGSCRRQPKSATWNFGGSLTATAMPAKPHSKCWKAGPRPSRFPFSNRGRYLKISIERAVRSARRSFSKSDWKESRRREGSTWSRF